MRVGSCVLYHSYYRIYGFGSFYIIVIIGYAGSGRAAGLVP